MLILNDYEITEEVSHSFSMSFYRGIRQASKQQVLIKVLKEPHASFYNLARWRHDYEMAQNLPFPGILKPVELKRCGTSLALVFEDFGGQPLKNCQELLKDDLGNFLCAAMDIVKILKIVHRYGVHKNMNPYSIFIHPPTREIKITDFSLCSLSRTDRLCKGNSDLPYDTLAYISPEQSGRLNRVVDCRSDFYSLGVVFYETLTGQLPFDCKDAGALVHCHITRCPTPPHEYNKAIPTKISEILLKLLAKSPEERYQSAFQLETDFNTCCEQWQCNRRIEHFISYSDQQDGFCMHLKLQHSELNKHGNCQDSVLTTLRDLSILDWMALLKASRCFSQEESWTHFLCEWLRTLVEIAGAQRGTLALKKGERFFVEAKVADGEPQVFPSLPLEIYDDLSQGIIQYVRRTGETVILADACEEGAFIKDPYVVERHPRSILTLPLFKRSVLFGILYLENNLLTDAFSPDRLDILKMFSLQGCIFLENIRLSAELEKKTQSANHLPSGI